MDKETSVAHKGRQAFLVVLSGNIQNSDEKNRIDSYLQVVYINPMDLIGIKLIDQKSGDQALPSYAVRLDLFLLKYKKQQERLYYPMENGVSGHMIVVKHLTKSYISRDGAVSALEDVNLHIKKGEIFGIIGSSGAGKSSLIRCLNRLEEPDSGSIEIGGTVITDLKGKDLRLARRRIGMIFQQFNLLDSKTVYGNVAFPLKVAGYSRQDIQRRVYDILELVQLSDKANAYPSQLSGGQKQRVGIARALAVEPDVLLSDEATSALDPQTTFSILELLKDINRKLQLTIVLITHEMDVLRHICSEAAVIEAGRIVETGSVEQLFHRPESETAKQFVNIFNYYKAGSEAEKVVMLR